MPETGSRRAKPSAVATASWPVMASATRSTWCGVIAATMRSSSRMSSSSTVCRPAVSTRTASRPRARAAATPSRAIATASPPAVAGWTGSPSSRASVSSWATAAGRYTSAGTRYGVRPRSVASQRASFAVVVVFPEPFRPTSMMITGVGPPRSSPAGRSPRSRVSSRCTSLTKCCSGVRLRSTSAPSASRLTASTKSRTTFRLTSASRRARRTSCSASSMFRSVISPCPRSLRSRESNFSPRDSNIAGGGRCFRKGRGYCSDAKPVKERAHKRIHAPGGGRDASPRSAWAPAAACGGPRRAPLGRAAALHHAAHAARRHGRGGRLLLRLLGHHRLGGEEKPRHRRGVEQRRAHHLGRVDDACFEQILVLLARGVEAEGALSVLHLVEHDRALGAGVVRDPAQRLHDRLLHDLDAEALVVRNVELVEHRAGADERHAAARHDALLDRGPRRVERVLDARLLLLHLDLGRRPDAHDRHAADQLGEPLLELLAVVVRGGLLDLRPDLLDAALDVALLAGAAADGGVVLVDHAALAAPEVLERDVLELHAELYRDHAAAGQDADVLEHRLAAVTEARGLHAHARERASDLVDHQGGERLALQILRDDEEWLAGTGHLLEQREQVLHCRDLLLVNQDVDVLVDGLHAVRVGDEVGTQISAVELHALDHLELRVEALRLLDRDHALLPHLAHRLGDDLADGRVVVGGDGADLRDLLLLFGGLGERLELLHDRLDRLVDAALERHRVVAGDHHLEALGEDGACEHGGRRRPVARHVGGLGGDLLHHLRPHVLELVFQLDLLRHRDAVLGHGGSAERLVEHHVAAAGHERHRHRIGQDVHAAEDLLARVLAELHQLCCHVVSPSSAFDHAEDVLLAHDEVLLAVDLDLRSGVLPEQDLVADLDVEGHHFAVVVHLAFADRDDLAVLRLLLGGIRDDDAALRLLHRLFEAPHDDAILKWPDLHAHRSFPDALSPRNAGKLRRLPPMGVPGDVQIAAP